MPRPQKVRVGDMLVERGLVTPQQLQQALEEQKRSGRRLGRVLIERGYIGEEVLARALGAQLGVPFIDLRHQRLSAELVGRLPEAQARRFRALPLERSGDRTVVGLVDPTDLFAYDEISRLLKCEIDVAVVCESELLALIDRLYRHTEQISGLARELTDELGEMPAEFGELFGAVTGAEDAPVVRLLQTVFEEAVRLRASDIHIEPQDRSLRIRFRIDGVLHVQTEADAKIATAVALRLKVMSGLDISEKRLPQDGRFAVRIGAAMLDARLSTLPTQHGESVVIRLLNQSTGLLDLGRIGMPPHVVERVRRAIHRPSGMVLVTGPTGSGKTTTLYAALSELNTPEKKIVTVEDPVEYRLPGINQVQVHEKIDLGFGRVLLSVLRQDPDIILVGEMRDQETAEIGLRAAMTGHLVLSTLHTNDAVSTPIRLLDMGVPRYMVAMSLQLVLAQRLVRVLCESCARPHEPTAAEHEWLRIELGEAAGRLVCREGGGCAHCNGTGYRGRTGVFEMLEMTRRVVEAANSDDPAAFVRVARAQMAGNSLHHDALRLVGAGRTTLEEAMRVANQQDEE